VPPTYRQRLRAEGAMLALSGAVGSALLLALTGTAARWPLNTAAQLAVVAALLLFFGPRGVRKAVAGARPLAPGELGSGEPTPLWQHPLIVAGLTLLVGLPTGAWDAGLRVTLGCVLVGLCQAVVLERLVARAEAAEGRTYLRIKGSRIGRGTRLGHPA
jgi:hypothetical protein